MQPRKSVLVVVLLASNSVAKNGKEEARLLDLATLIEACMSP